MGPFESPAATECSNCGRYVGAEKSCPYCGAALASRPITRWLQIGGLVLALAGVALLLVAARRTAVPRYQIADLTPTMNLAYLQLAGVVSSAPRYDEESGSLGFWLDDGSGELYVAAFGDQAKELVAAGRVPRLADRVELAGTLRWREDFLSLTLNLPESLSIERPAAVLTEIGALTPTVQNQVVQLVAVVRGVRQPYDGLTLVELRDATGSVEVAIEQETLDMTGALDPAVLESGRTVQVDGVVTLYQNSPQVTLTGADAMRVLPAALEFAPMQTIATLNPDAAGSFVRVAGSVIDVQSFSAGLKVWLDDDSGVVTVLLWQDLAGQLEQPIEMGARVEAAGELALYRGELEIIPEIPADLEVVVAAQANEPAVEEPVTPEAPAAIETPTELVPTPTPTAEPTPWPVIPIAEVSVLDVGRTMLVEARVVGVESFSAGFKFVLDDNSGVLELLVWTDRYLELDTRANLRPGALLRAWGVVNYYDGVLQLEPAAAGDLEILEPGLGPAVDVAPTGGLDAHLGEQVAVKGTLTGWQSFGSGNLRLTLDDGSGPATVVVWNNVLQGLDPDLLEAGASLHVVGVVESYEASTQLVPALPVYLSRP